MKDPELHLFDYTAMVIYMLLVVGLGVYFSRRRENSTEDYLLGGRKMRWWVIGISYYISLLSTLSLVAVPGEAFNYGLSMMALGILMPITSVIAFHIFVRFYFQSAVYTPYTYLERRFSPSIRSFIAALFCLMRILYLAVVLYSCSLIFEGASGWPAWFSILLVGIIGILYTTIGGIQAVVWSDVLQFFVLVGGILIVVIVCVAKLPYGIGGIVEYSFAHGRGFEYFKDPQFYRMSPFIRLNLWVMIISAIGTEMFNNSADQISIQRLLCTSSYKEARKSIFTYAFISLPWGLVLSFIGLAMYVFYAHNPAQSEVTGDTALFHFISTQLPSPVPGIIVSAMLAAVMSTLDSGINSLSTVVTKDFYLRIFRPQASEGQQVFFSKGMTLGIGALAVLFALIIAMTNKRIGQTMIEVASLWFAFFNVVWPIFFLGVTSVRLTSKHIYACVAVSWTVTVAMVVVFLVTKGTDQPVSFMWLSFPGMVTMLLAGYVMALFTKPLPEQKTKGLTLWTLARDADKKLEKEPNELTTPPDDS